MELGEGLRNLGHSRTQSLGFEIYKQLCDREGGGTQSHRENKAPKKRKD